MAEAAFQLMLVRVFLVFTLLLPISGVAHADDAGTITASPPSSSASTSRFVFTGHNVTQTANFYPVGGCTVGTNYAACGVHDRVTAGVSPWLWNSYNMANVSARFRLSESSSRSDAIQVGYFKTFETGRKANVDTTQSQENIDYQCRSRNEAECFTGYEMESVWTYYVVSRKMAPNYRQHLNVQIAYYWDDKKPFSLRRPQVWKTPFQFNVTSLHEAHLVGPYHIQVETGFLGLDGKYPALHAGMAGSYRGTDWAVQIGATATGSLNGWLNYTGRTDVHSNALFMSQRGLDREFTDDEVQRDFSVHPEFFAQYSFLL